MVPYQGYDHHVALICHETTLCVTKLRYVRPYKQFYLLGIHRRGKCDDVPTSGFDCWLFALMSGGGSLFARRLLNSDLLFLRETPATGFAV